ncbi:MAG TPA: BrnT family toxin [Polyangiales bacterium]|nr:BrnT family toxin [Polyangiales bacterium]
MAAFPDALAQCVGFQRDAGNSDKNWELHHVSRPEAEQIFFNRPIVVTADAKHSQVEARFAALGQANDGRLLLVIFTIRQNLIRVISVRDQSQEERKVYVQAQNKD